METIRTINQAVIKMSKNEIHQRFTRDGSDALEEMLKRLCQNVAERVKKLIPEQILDALVLGGGYGRGEGGVLRLNHQDHPYNDLEFFLFLGGPVRWNERKFGAALHELAEELSEEAGLEVEIKVTSLQTLRRSSGSMFFYDLVCGHHVVIGSPEILEGFDHLRDATSISLHESLRLLMNRCSGLLFSLDRLRASDFSAEDTDFVGRNLAKAQLAVGDVVLSALGRYHWSCLEREKRLQNVETDLPLEAIRAHHRRGVQFKLRPRCSQLNRSELLKLHGEVSETAWMVWRWLEAQRLAKPVPTPTAYADLRASKCPETRALKNLLIRMRTFGFRGVFHSRAFRYPREAMLNTLPLLLWGERNSSRSHAFLANQLVEEVTRWTDGVAAYTKLWKSFN